MEISNKYMNYDANISCSEESENETDSESYDVYSPDPTDECHLIKPEDSQHTRKMYRRISHYIDPMRIFTQKSSRHNASIKRFLFCFCLTSSLIILTQIYLSMDFNGYSLQGWERNRSRSISFYILPNNITTLIEPVELCKENVSILLLVVIFSAPYNFDVRQTLRETWANTTEFNYSKFFAIHSRFKGKYLPINHPDLQKYIIRNDDILSMESSQDSTLPINSIDESSHVDFHIRTVFLIGQTENNDTQNRIVNESRTHNDLIQESFFDSYNNLTLKSAMMVKWIKNNCIDKVKFFMKCDDDTFVNIPNLIHFLLGGTIPAYGAVQQFYNEQTVQTLDTRNRLTQYENLLVGFRFCHSKPVTDFRNKWFTPYYMYQRKVFPNYLSVSGYVFTLDTAVKLYNASLQTPLLHLEDVYLTGICAEKAGIEPKHFHLFNYLSYNHLCEFRGMVTAHEIKIDDMKKAYDFVINPKITCAKLNKRIIARLKKPTKLC